MIVQTNAIVLHRMKYKNSSLIARLFTKDSGKISIIMNGASKQKGNIFGIIEPPNIIKLNYYERKQGSLQTCKEASFIHNNTLIKKDIIKLSAALSVVEILDKTFHEYDVHTDVYHLACEALKKINASDCDSKIILCFFLIKLIEKLGFMLDQSNQNNIYNGINPEMKSVLIYLNNSSIENLNTINQYNINPVEIIIFLENYIKQHLKINKNIQSLKMIKEIAYG